ncbi:MAG: hypothetical protein LBK95_02185 [Bifidobacteriaceae bacterium]|jgi:hypothetical protein|nr:hypothetical protein [Bifidobacteriaceae bacterium]
MVAVLASFTIAMVMVLGSLAYLSASTKYSRHEQDSDRALAAARSGVADLLARLRLDPIYLDAMATKAGVAGTYCTNPAAGGPASEGDKFATDCGWSHTQPQWESMEGSGGHKQYYHYAIVDYSQASHDVEVMASGKANNVVRTVKASISPETPPMWLYFSDYEVADPTDPITYPPTPTGDGYYGGTQLTSGACGGSGAGGAAAEVDLAYAWELKQPDNTKPARVYSSPTAAGIPCKEPSFEKWDALDGPVHSNDTIKANGTQFGGDFTTTDPKCKGATAGDPASWQACVNGGSVPVAFSSLPRHRTKLDLPTVANPANESALGTGCFYQGPTRIILEPGGTMRVWSKQSDPAEVRAGCGSIDDLRSPGGASVPVPADGLVFVGEAPKTGHHQIPARGIGGPSGQELPLGDYDPTAMVPGPTSHYTVERAMYKRAEQYSDMGNLYVEGELAGQLTLAAQGTIVITGDLLTKDDDTDIMGLTASAIEIYNPVVQEIGWSCYGSPVQCTEKVPTEAKRETGWPKDYDGSSGTLRIEAALNASAGSFRLQNWRDGGPLGKLEVHGSVAQAFRGVVAWEDDSGALISGYEKRYTYNEKLREGRPLLFGPIGNGTWVIRWQEKAHPPEAVK